MSRSPPRQSLLGRRWRACSKKCSWPRGRTKDRHYQRRTRTPATSSSYSAQGAHQRNEPPWVPMHTPPPATTQSRALAATPPRGLGQATPSCPIIVESVLLRHDHAPGVEDQPRSCRSCRWPPGERPAIGSACRTASGGETSVRQRPERSFALLLRKGKAHQRLVTREGQIHDASDAELDPAPDEDLVRPRQPRRQISHVVDPHGHLATRLGHARGPRARRTTTYGGGLDCNGSAAFGIQLGPRHVST